VARLPNRPGRSLLSVIMMPALFRTTGTTPSTILFAIISSHLCARVTGLVNAAMQSQYWPNCAIIITWDDYGGFYDHVPPRQTDKYGFGFRVPCLVISPYSVANTVVHTQYDFTSILKLIEAKFYLASLTGRDSSANNMLDCFNFSQTPLPPDVLSTTAH